MLIESFALLQHRLALSSAVALQESSRAFDVVWIDEEIHREAASRWALARRSLSFVDHVSFVLMERPGLRLRSLSNPISPKRDSGSHSDEKRRLVRRREWFAIGRL